MDVTLQQVIDRGRTAFQNRDYVAALADLREVLAARPGFADLRNLAGLCLSLLGQPESALAEFDRALELNERYIEAHLNRAITLNELGRFEEARAAFERASHFESRTAGRFSSGVSARLANAHMAVGDLYLEAGATEEAAAQYEVALEMRPEFHDIRNKLAECHLRQSRFDDAERELRSALQGNPRFLAARLNLGLVHYYRADPARARAEWEDARRQAPGNPQVRAYLSLLDRDESLPAPQGD